MARHVSLLLLLAGLSLTCLSCTVMATCDFCGRECTSACGTTYFRTCCLNYLRKRSPSPQGSGFHLELMVLPELARYRPIKNPIETDDRMQIAYND